MPDDSQLTHEDHRLFDFHHIDPATKQFSIGTNGHCRKWEDVLIEIEKCIILCANCHRIEHWRLRNL